MPLTVAATAVVTSDEITRPRKLQMTPRMTAPLNEMERVPTASAMALAASVAPLMKMVITTRTIAISRGTLVVSSARKSGSDAMVNSLLVSGGL